MELSSFRVRIGLPVVGSPVALLSLVPAKVEELMLLLLLLIVILLLLLL